MERPRRSAEGRQRWRIAFRRAAMPDAASADQAEAWAAALAASGLPVAGLADEPPRIRSAFAAPLPAAHAGERELLDIVLTKRLTVEDVRRRLLAAMPSGSALVDLHDVWLGEPPLPGQVVAADYRIVLATAKPALSKAVLRRAAAALLAAEALPRERDRGAVRVAYDLRPLLVDVRLSDAGPPPVMVCRVRFDPERGVGRPQEVVAALGEAAGVPGLRASDVVRERLILAGDAADAAADARGARK